MPRYNKPDPVAAGGIESCRDAPCGGMFIGTGSGEELRAQYGKAVSGMERYGG